MMDGKPRSPLCDFNPHAENTSQLAGAFAGGYPLHSTLRE